MANNPLDTSLLDRAIIFAVHAHAGTERRGKGFPYIVHPMEAVEIVATMTSDQELLAAAALHDTVEDTDVTVEQIRQEFGERVASLVADETDISFGSQGCAGQPILPTEAGPLPFREPMSSRPASPDCPIEQDWRARKRVAIERLAKASRDAKIVALGDKLSNMRAIARDYAVKGDALWTLFHAKDRKDHEWHYRGLADSLRELSDTFAFKEFEQLVNQVFNGSD